MGSRRGKRKGRARLAPAPPPSRGAPAWVEGGTASPSHFLSSRSSPPPVASSPSFLSRGPPVPRAGAEDRPTLRTDWGADRTLSSGLQLEIFERPGAPGAVGVKDTLLVIPRRTTALQRLLPARHREAWLTQVTQHLGDSCDSGLCRRSSYHPRRPQIPVYLPMLCGSLGFRTLWNPLPSPSLVEHPLCAGLWEPSWDTLLLPVEQRV